MEKGIETLFENQQIDPNLWSSPSGFHPRLNIPSLGNMFSPNVTNGNLPMFTFETTKPEEYSGWFLGLSHSRNGFIPATHAISKPQLPELQAQPQAPQEVQKKFLVFDQSNDRTTMVYVLAPFQYHLLRKEISIIEKHEDTCLSNPLLDDGNNEVSETREDIEELEALLYSYSDDDDDDDDDIDHSEDEEE